MKKFVLGLSTIIMVTSVTYANSKLSCNSLELSINLTCPTDILASKKDVSYIIGDLKDMQYRCRQKNCSNAQKINQGIFLLEEAYQKFDTAYEINFSNKKCLRGKESYLDKIRNKIKSCEVANKNIDTAKSLF